jgi:hypothetical protein
MGLLKPRAMCINCGTKVHTRPCPSNTSLKERTLGATPVGKVCPSCGAKFTGKISLTGHRAYVEEPEPRAE